MDVNELEMSLSAMGARYGRARVKQEGGDTEMEDLTLVIILVLCFCKAVVFKGELP